MYKNCYFFGTSNGNIYVQTPRTTKSIARSDLNITINGNKEVVSVKDMSNGVIYYPADDCKRIQDWECADGFHCEDGEGNSKRLSVDVRKDDE